MLYDLRPYLYFVTVADELSFTAAAARLNVAQPWLSTAIRQLEARVGFTLFERTTRRVTLTADGARLLGAARAAIAAVDQVEAAAQEIRNDEAIVVLGILPFAIDMPVVEAVINRLTYEHPQCHMQLDVGLSNTLTARTRSGKLHAAFVLGRRDIGELEQVKLADFELVIGVYPDDPLATKERIEPADLRGRSVVTFPRSSDPALFDQVYAPFIDAGATLEPNAQIWSQTFQPAAGQVTATLNIKTNGGGVGLKRRRLHFAPRTPFYLLRSTRNAPAGIGVLWDIACEVADTSPRR